MLSTDGISGMGVITYAMESIGFGLGTEQYGATYFGSGGLPKVVIESEKKFNTEQRRNFRKEWKEMYGGPDGDKVGVLPMGSKPHVLNITQEESQFLETRQHNIEEIARWYGVPPHKLQHLLRATFNNIEHLAIEFVTDTMTPWLVLWEEELNAKLLTESERADYYFKFNVNALLRGDSAARANFYQSAINNGSMSPNDVREREDENPYQGGDVYLIQGALRPVESAGSEFQPQQPAAQMKKTLKRHERLLDAMAVKIDSAQSGNGDVAGLHRELDNLRSEFDDRLADSREAQLESAKAVLIQSLRRMIRKHAQATRRAMKEPASFLDWLDTEQNREKFIENLRDAADALTPLGIHMDATAIVSEHLSRAAEELLEASGSPPEHFESAVETILSSYENGLAEQIATSILEASHADH
jgi:hypothetical protein